MGIFQLELINLIMFFFPVSLVVITTFLTVLVGCDNVERPTGNKKQVLNGTTLIKVIKIN
jgi:hypothetical protein